MFFPSYVAQFALPHCCMFEICREASKAALSHSSLTNMRRIWGSMRISYDWIYLAGKARAWNGCIIGGTNKNWHIIIFSDTPSLWHNSIWRSCGGNTFGPSTKVMANEQMGRKMSKLEISWIGDLSGQASATWHLKLVMRIRVDSLGMMLGSLYLPINISNAFEYIHIHHSSSLGALPT